MDWFKGCESSTLTPSSSCSSVMASLSLSFSSSIVPSSIPHHKSTKIHTQDSTFRVTCFAISSPPSKPVIKKRHWKKGEFPGTSETSVDDSTRRTPIKNIKRKLEKKNSAKAWVNTVTESLSEQIDKKQWLQALQVFTIKFNTFTCVWEEIEGFFCRLFI